MAEPMSGHVGAASLMTQARPDGQEEVDGETHHGRHRAPSVELPVQKRPGMDPEDEETDGRGRQEGHEMVADAEGEDERHQDQEVVVLALPQVLLPPEGQPGEEGDGEEGDGVDLLVDVRLVPDGEGRGAHQDRRRSPGQAEAPIFREVAEHVVDHEEPEGMRPGAHEGAEEVHPHGDRQSQGRQQQGPRLGQHDEEGVPGGMGDAQDVRRGDVLARVPERGRGRQREGVQGEDRGADHPRIQIRGLQVPLVDGRHRRGGIATAAAPTASRSL